MAVGSHGARGLVMFGFCQSLKWAPNPEPVDAQMYPSVIDVGWERTVFEVDPESFPTRPGRSASGFPATSTTRGDARRSRSPKPTSIEYITAPNGAARAI